MWGRKIAMICNYFGKRLRGAILSAFVLLFGLQLLGSIFGSFRGIVHDPQHRPIQGATVQLRAISSDWNASATTDANGEFRFNAVPVGQYAVTVSSGGFAPAGQSVLVAANTQPVAHFQLQVAAGQVRVTVSAAPEAVPTDTATPTTIVSREQIRRAPGADRTNSLAMITDFVPGAYITHDQLHIRGGHQVSWLVDGVPVPNTNIASNVGPQFDPKDVDYLEVDRGSYGADLGDRTYGVFNIAPRTGFERNSEAELITSFGNFYQTNDELNFGNHTERFAYYASLNGNRSDLGLQPATAQVVHDAENGYGGFSSVIFNPDPSNQLRLITSLRKDYYQVPYDPNPASFENSQYDTSRLRDGQHEADAIVNFSWVHSFDPKLLLTVSPFYHRNSSNYDSNPNDYPVATTDHHSSSYVGGQASFSASLPKNNLQVGVYSFYQRDNQLLAVVAKDGTEGLSPVRNAASGALTAFFIDDRFRPVPWLTLIVGMRPTNFSGGITESAVSPRFGAALQVPRLHWVLRAFYGHYYQAPPLVTASGPLLHFVTGNDLGFLPLHGERDEEHQFGISIPFRGWTLDADNFKTIAHNFFDHNSVGESNLFIPLTIQEAIIQGWELTLRSPRIAHRAQIHLAYSNQIAQAEGSITGGLTDFSLPAGLSPLDHDQRNTLNVGGYVSLPWRGFASTNVYYGSGFSNGLSDVAGSPYAGAYLPGHITVDLSVGKELGEKTSISLNVLNIANRRVLLDNSVTFGGFHWNNPREIYCELRYRFHY
jgi:outer membrane receptor protein involved in Fe transport